MIVELWDAGNLPHFKAILPEIPIDHSRISERLEKWTKDGTGLPRRGHHDDPGQRFVKMCVPPTVIKVGGSLLDWPKLPSRLSQFLERRARRHRGHHLLISGGGATADVIRAMDRIHGLGDETAHDLAIRSLDLNARLLSRLLPGTRVVDGPETLRSTWNQGFIPVLAPWRFVTELDRGSPSPLPRSWDVTSDSIAARIATLIGAETLILLKSTPLPIGADRWAASRLGLIDPAFPGLASAIRSVEYVCLREDVPRSQILSP